MLKAIDVLIGLSTIMLLASLIVMAITQFMATIVRLRSTNLRKGLVAMLGQIDPQFTKDFSNRVVKTLLCLPSFRSGTGKAGTVVPLEGFTRSLLELATDPPAGQTPPGTLNGSDRTLLRNILRANGIAEPEKTLERVRNLALQIERLNPELTADIRQRIAIVQEAESKFVASVHTLFDRTMDRISERFTLHTRWWTTGVAIVVVIVLQLDVIALVNRLNLDSAGRDAIVNKVAPKAKELAEQANVLSKAAGDATGTDAQKKESQVTAEDLRKAAADLQSKVTEATGALQTEEIMPMPTRADWGKWSVSKGLGMLLAMIMVSLGAPFWYKALATLIQLRSVAAQKDDAQRAARTTPPETAEGAAPATATAVPATTPEWVRGEQGDVALVG